MLVRIMTVPRVVNSESIMKGGAICRLSNGDVCSDVSFEQTESTALCCACLSFSSSVFLGLFLQLWIPQIDETSNRLLCRQRAIRDDDCHRVLASLLVQNGLLFRSFEMSRQRAY